MFLEEYQIDLQWTVIDDTLLPALQLQYKNKK